MADHPTTPPTELVQQWVAEIWHEGTPVQVSASDIHIATQAARWGADQELEACCEWLRCQNLVTHCALIPSLRAARRPKPKPPSLKEQALDVLQRYTSGEIVLMDSGIDTIRRALEALPND